MTRWRRIGLGIGIAVVLVVLGGVVALVGAPGVAGADEAFIVTSESMSPTLERGDVVLVSATDPADLEEGNIVTVAGAGEDGSFMTHRIVERYEDDGQYYVETQGDANEVSDGVISADRVVGVVDHHIPHAGWPLLFARSSVGLALLIVLTGLLLFGIGLVQLAKALDLRGRLER